jgi:hypothetical protein
LPDRPLVAIVYSRLGTPNATPNGWHQGSKEQVSSYGSLKTEEKTER